MIPTQGNLISDPSLAEVLENAIDSTLIGVNVSMPGQITSYDAATNSASIQPVIKRSYADGRSVNLPIINGVPIIFPRSGKAFLSFPLQPNDYVMLVFSQRSLEIWLNQGGVVDPNDPRKFALSDAVAFPGCYPYNQAVAADTSNVVLKNDQAKISLLPTGKFRFEQVGGDEFLDLVSQICDGLTQAMTNTLIGPQPLINAATFSMIKAKIAAIKG